MGKRADKKSRRYWLSAKPLSRKKKYAERRKKKMQNEIVVMPPAILNGVDFPTTQPAAGNSKPAETTAAVDYRQGNGVIAEKRAADFIYDVQIESLDNSDYHGEFLCAVISDTSLPDFTVEQGSEAKKGELELPGTWHVVDFEHIFAEWHRKFDNHNPVYQCTLNAVHLVLTLRVGLKTRFVFKCSRCLKEEGIMSEPEDSSVLSVDQSAVAGAASTGYLSTVLR